MKKTQKRSRTFTSKTGNKPCTPSTLQAMVACCQFFFFIFLSYRFEHWSFSSLEHVRVVDTK